MNILFSWLSPLRVICMAIDGVLYSLLDNAYDLVIKLSTAELLKHTTIKSLTENLYIIFGVVAFFRLALLLVNAIIDPEKLNEKGKGLSNIFFRVVGMIILLAVTPFLFEMSYELQGKIVGADASQNIIFKTILGNNANIASSDNSNAGKALQNIALSSLITIDKNYLVKNGAQCKYEEIKDENGKVTGYDYTKITNEDNYGFCPLICISNGDGTCTPQGGYVYDENKCDWPNCRNAVDTYNEMYANEDMSPSKLASYVGVYTKIEDENGEKQDVFVYNYMFVITGVVGVAMTYIIISFAIDIAVRMFELIVLEILSPLFIATFVDPKSAQSGPFKNWLSAVGKSYASLYLRLAIIALMILLVSIINQSKMFQSMGDVSGWAKIFMVIGLLIFAKKAPKWIGDMIGIKGEGGLGGLSIGKKLGGMFLAGGLANKATAAMKTGAKALGGAAAARLGGTAAARVLKRNNQAANLGNSKKRFEESLAEARKNNKSKAKALGSYFNKELKLAKDRAKAGIAGGQAAAMNGLKAGAKAKDVGEVMGILGKSYKEMTEKAGYEGIAKKMNMKFDDLQATIEGAAIGSQSELRNLKEAREKIAKADKYRNKKIELDSKGKRKEFDFQNGIEMNRAAQIASSKEPGFSLKHDPTSANEVYMADMINNGLASKVTMDTKGNITSFVDKSGNRITGSAVSKALEAYGNSKFSMSGRDQITLDCANNISKAQDSYLTAKSKLKEIEKSFSDMNVNMSKLNMDRATIISNSNMDKNITVSLTDSTGKVGDVNMTLSKAYEYYQTATDPKIKAEYEAVLRNTIPSQFEALKSIDASIMDINVSSKKLEDAKKAWGVEKDEQESLLVKICEEFADPKDNPLANPDGVTIVGSYENEKFVKDSDKSKVYSTEVAKENTQNKINKLQEKAKASYEDGKESNNKN